MTLYRDRFICCSEDEIIISWYYFPFGSKHIAYTAVKSVTEVALTAWRGKGRIWGTGNLSYWANLDFGRPRKSRGLTIDVGKSVKAFITPDDPGAVAEIIASRTGLSVRTGDSPFI